MLGAQPPGFTRGYSRVSPSGFSSTIELLCIGRYCLIVNLLNRGASPEGA